MQDEGEAVEPHHLAEPAGEVVGQGRQVAVGDDRLGAGQEGAVLVAPAGP